MSLRRFLVALVCLHFVASLLGPRLAAAPEGTRLLRIADRQRDADRVRLRQQHLDGRARRRHRAPPHELPGTDDEPALLARRQVDRVQRRVRRQHRRLRRAGRRRRAEAADVASRRRRRAGLDARRQVDRVRLVARDVGAERRAALLDRAGRGRRRGADGAAARLSGQDLARRHAHRLSHEQLVGRRAAQLSRRPEPPDLDRRSQDATISSRRRGPTRRTSIRSGSATRVYFLSDRDGVLERLVVRHEERRSWRRSRSSPTST